MCGTTKDRPSTTWTPLPSGYQRGGGWGLELVAWFAAVVMGFVVLQRAFGAWPALVGSFAWLGGLALLLERRNHLSNLTEAYSLPFHFAALLLFSGATATPLAGWRGTLLGATAVACFLLRPNLIGLPVVAAILLVAPRLRERR